MPIINMSGTTPNTRVEPIKENLPKIVCSVAEVIARAIPLKMLELANEVINEGALKTMDVTPTNKSHIIAMEIPHSTTIQIGTDALIMIAMTEAVKPIIAPTEISKLPEIIKIVAPDATTPNVAICSKMLMIFANRKNLGFINPVTTEIAMITIRSINHCARNILFVIVLAIFFSIQIKSQ